MSESKYIGEVIKKTLNNSLNGETMKKTIILFCIILCLGCESNQGNSQSVLQIVQTEKLKTQIDQLTATVEAQQAEIKQIKTESADKEALYKEQVAELESQISRLQANIEQQKAEIEQLTATEQEIETQQPEVVEDSNN